MSKPAEHTPGRADQRHPLGWRRQPSAPRRRHL